MIFVGVMMGVAYAALGLFTIAAVIAAPIVLGVEGAKQVKARISRPKPLTRERARTQAELKEQYASGILTLVGLEERLDDTFRARTHLELEHVLDDLPARPPELPRAARVEVFAALAIVLAFHSLAARVAGVALGIGAVLPATRWRSVAYAFLAGATLLTAPFAAIPVGLCAAWRWSEERR